MQMYLTNDVPSQAIERDEQYHALQLECFVLRKHYQALYEQHQALFERCATWQWGSPGTVASRETLQDFRQSQQEQRRVIQHFRIALQTHRNSLRDYCSKYSSHIQASQPLLRKTILFGVGNEKAAAFLKESVQHVGTYRVFQAVDSSEVLCIMHNVHIDLLVLDDDLTPLPSIELYHHLHGMQELKALPAIIISTCFSSLQQAELLHSHFVGLEKPIKADVLLKAIDQLLV